MPEARVRRSYVLPGAGLVKDATPQPTAVARSGYLAVEAAGCSGCHVCEMVCALHHEGEARPALARLTVSHDPFTQSHPEVAVCPQCLGPECLLVCPTGAIAADPASGARIVDDELCNGCGLCVKACHLGMIQLEPRRKKAFKCDLCGGEPLCAVHCPQQVITFKARRAS